MSVNNYDFQAGDFEIDSKVSEASKKASDQIGQESFSSWNNVDFAGIDKDNQEEFKKAMQNYQNGVKDILNGLNTDPGMADALKGPVAGAYQSFLTSIDTLLERYVSALDNEINELNTAFSTVLKSNRNFHNQIVKDSSAIKGITIE